jgi:hypothetical protein
VEPWVANIETFDCISQKAIIFILAAVRTRNLVTNCLTMFIFWFVTPFNWQKDVAVSERHTVSIFRTEEAMLGINRRISTDKIISEINVSRGKKRCRNG